MPGPAEAACLPLMREAAILPEEKTPPVAPVIAREQHGRGDPKDMHRICFLFSDTIPKNSFSIWILLEICGIVFTYVKIPLCG